jgi:hypothetical protein
MVRKLQQALNIFVVLTAGFYCMKTMAQSSDKFPAPLGIA